MIRRPPTRITISQKDVEEALTEYRNFIEEHKADKEANAALDAAGAKQKKATDDRMQTDEQQDTDVPTGASTHPADERAREREQRTTAQRLGA